MAVVLSMGMSGVGARTRVSFNDGWEFSREGGAFAPVTVPHDWAIAGPFDPEGDGDTGKLPWKGEGVYRKSMVVTEKPSQRVFLDLDGAMAHACVYVNGQACGRNLYAYLGFRADLTPYLFVGTNVVEVKCETKNFHSRWYPGGGLYRNTWLVKTDTVYLQDDSLRVETRDVLSGEAKLKVSGGIVSRRPDRVKAKIIAVLKDPAGAVVATAGDSEGVDGYATDDFSLKMKVKDPQLWKMVDGAALYTLELTASGEGFSDTLVRRIGFREAKFDPKRGFFLNGERVPLKGVDLHSDLGPLGMAFDVDAMRRQLSVMREMGANALRTSHNCPAPEVLDLCDEMGFFVWNECFDKWNITAGRTANDPLEDFIPPILAAWVRRDRTHPSVFCWSIGNEITPGDATPPGQENWWTKANDGTSAERCARFRHVVREEDETRPVGIGSCFPSAGLRGDYEALDLSGWNYRGMYEEIHAKYPRQPLVYSESASALSEFGYYADRLPTNKTDFAVRDLRVDSYDYNAAGWSDIPDREFYRMDRDQYCAGEFVWTGIDYLGEPTPYNKWGTVTKQNAKACSRSSYFGICDLCALPKDRYYLYRAHWNPEAFTLHLVPDHWNFPQKAGKTLPVFVYTSADEAELFVNGKSQGRRKKDKSAGNLDEYYSVLPRYRLMWNEVPYEPGEVKVVAYGRDGAVLGEQSIRTAGEPVKVVLSPERVYGSLCVVKVSLADKDGNVVPNDNRRISFAIEGGEILAVGNSDPRGLDSFKDVSGHPLRFGRAAVYVRLAEGPVTLKASAEGLRAGEARIAR